MVDTLEKIAHGSTTFRDLEIAECSWEMIARTTRRVVDSKNLGITEDEIQTIIGDNRTLGDLFDYFEERFDFNFQGAFEKKVVVVAGELANEDPPPAETDES